MKRSYSALAILFAVMTMNCAGASPTAPTPTTTTALRWDITAPGCAPARPSPNPGGAPETQSTTLATGAISARWLVAEQGDMRRYVVGEFNAVGVAVYGLCSWATLERRVDR